MANELDKLLAGLETANNKMDVRKVSATSEGAGTWHSLWKLGDWPVAGANPPVASAGSGYSPTDATAGAWSFVNPSAGFKKYLLQAAISGATSGTLILYDRLWACSGFVTNSASGQNVTTPGSIPARDSNGASNGDGVELWLEVYSAPGATGATWTINYVDQSGNNAAATYTHPANAESVGQMMPVVLAAGDTGVRGLQATSAFTCSISSGTAGDVGVTLMRRIAEVPLTLANVTTVFDAIALGMPRIYDDSCLALMVRCTATNTGLIQGNFIIGDVAD
jgi:hypothetical protein